MIELEKNKTYEAADINPSDRIVPFIIELTGRLGRAASDFLKETGLKDDVIRGLKNDIAAAIAYANGECMAHINARARNSQEKIPTIMRQRPMASAATNSSSEQCEDAFSMEGFKRFYKGYMSPHRPDGSSLDRTPSTSYPTVGITTPNHIEASRIELPLLEPIEITRQIGKRRRETPRVLGLR